MLLNVLGLKRYAIFLMPYLKTCTVRATVNLSLMMVILSVERDPKGFHQDLHHSNQVIYECTHFIILHVLCTDTGVTCIFSTHILSMLSIDDGLWDGIHCLPFTVLDIHTCIITNDVLNRLSEFGSYWK